MTEKLMWSFGLNKFFVSLRNIIFVGRFKPKSDTRGDEKVTWLHEQRAAEWLGFGGDVSFPFMDDPMLCFQIKSDISSGKQSTPNVTDGIGGVSAVVIDIATLRPNHEV